MHDLGIYSDAELVERLAVLGRGFWSPEEYDAGMCQCDDFEVDEGWVIRQCPYNDDRAIDAELATRELMAVR